MQGISRLGAIMASALALCALAVQAPPASAQDAAAFYRGKVLTLVIGYGPGGGYDAYARLLAPELERRTGATVVVANRPGGGGLLALNQVAAAKPDGLTLMLISGAAAVLGQLTEREGLRYDLLDLAWLARVSHDKFIWLAGAKAPARSLPEILNSPRAIKFAAGGKTDGISDLEAVICKALKLECKIIIGYKGSKEAALAVMRGEADALVVSAPSARRYARRGKMIAVAAVGRQRSRLFADLPTLFEQVELAPEQAWWIDFHETMRRIGRALVTSSGVPEDRVAYLRAVFDGILTDPDLIARASASGRFIDHAPADKIRGFAQELLAAIPPERLRELRRVILEAYF